MQPTPCGRSIRRRPFAQMGFPCGRRPARIPGGYGAGRNGSGLPMNTAHRRPVRGDGAVGYSRTSIPNNSAALAIVARATSSKLIPRSSAMRSATYIT